MSLLVKPTLTLVAAGLVFFSACDAGRNAGPVPAFDSWLAQVEIREVSGAPVEDCPGLEPPVALLNSAEFSLIVDAKFLRDGRVAVADYRVGSVIIVAASGTENVLGRAGEGPGEFRRLMGLALLGDTVLAWDSSLHRVTALTPDGEVLWTERLLPNFPGSWTGDFLGRTSSGHYAFLGTRHVFTSPGSQYRDTATYLGIMPDEEEVMEGVQVPSTFQSTFKEGRGMRTMPQIFSPEAHLAVAAGLAWIAESGSGVVVRLNRSGRPERGLRISPHPITVTEAMIAQERQVLRSMGPGATSVGSSDVAAELPAFDVLPVFSRITGTAEGDIWLSEYVTRASASSRHWVVDSAAQYVGCVVTDPAFRVMDAWNGRLLLLGRDSLDVPFLVVHEYPQGWR